jgi:hypothetical protein
MADAPINGDDPTHQQALLAALAALEAAEERERVANAKLTFEHWTTMGALWEQTTVPYSESGSPAKFRNIRNNHCPSPYRKLLADLGLERDSIIPRQDSSIIDESIAPSLSSGQDGDSRTVNTKDSAGTMNHKNRYQRTLRGERFSNSEKSQAHCLAKDKMSHEFAIPLLQVILGNQANEIDPSDMSRLMENLVRLYINRICFDHEHSNSFDTLRFSNVVVLPVLASIDEVGLWDYKTPYPMLVVSSNKKGYQQLGITGLEGHIREAEVDDVRMATNHLVETMQMLAESLDTNWESSYAQRPKCAN